MILDLCHRYVYNMFFLVVIKSIRIGYIVHNVKNAHKRCCYLYNVYTLVHEYT